MALDNSRQMRRRILMFLQRGCAVVFCLVASGCVQKDEPIVAGTALMQCAVQDLMPEAAISPALIPPGSCPGHYDMRPGDIRRVAACNALLLHTWQETKPNITSVVRASGIPPENVLVVPVPGNWMVPDAYADALESLAALLESKELGTQNLAARAEQRISEVRMSGRRLQNRLQTAGAPNTVVLCQDMVVPFVEWAGFSMAGAFGRSEELSVSDVDALVKLGKARGVSLVIDNLQSGDEKTGEALARELGAERVIISNFPGGLPNTNTWDRALARNAELLLEALDRLRLPSS